ncbi:MAG TPA: glutamine--fructose-6-phosphate aminotransferase, partial [Conexibacter sp.]|nr:glutamine--fructose-6-phosphate aminotransferase [Conexibacter sp.]
MCGIVGYVGQRPALELLLGGLERLEYRGYDSAGVALLGDDGGALRVRSVGGIAQLRDALVRHPELAAMRSSRTGIGHTRWATHGRVSEGNAHPLSDDGQRVQIVLNGIVENHDELRALLVAEGARFDSDTDAEVVAHLVARSLERGGLADAVRESLRKLQGHFAFVAATPDEPGTLVGTRRACPLVVGHADGERFVGSALVGLPGEVAGAHVIEDDEVVVLDAL